ncbi:MAG: peptidoglycan bridge formation glycyltransferase FemA/FemB family protein [Parcubacteria group bacterium]|nr:peptidoglycan bridge formation glycyltransferase FemA/FemB family protein [Parcubacteria group bacterium]
MLTHWLADKRAQWDILAAKSADGGLLQSWAWGEFQAAQGNRVYRVSDEAGQWLAQCLRLRAGKQWILVVPRGPVGSGDQSSLQAFLSDLRSLAREEGCFLMRLDPAWTKIDTIPGVYKSSRERQPVHTLVMDTTPSEEAILAGMKGKWRYNIGLAQKKGVTVRRSANEKDAAVFTDLVAKTTDRQGFASYDTAYFATLLKTLAPAKQAEFFIAEYQGQPIAAILAGYFGRVAAYLHGASDYQHRALMAPHLLQWEAIKAAKARGMAYDFWGTACEPPANEQEKAWVGVTRFKRGFVPATPMVEYVGTYEMPVKTGLYPLYRLRQWVKR